MMGNIGTGDSVETIVAALLEKYPGYGLFVKDLECLVRNQNGDAEAIEQYLAKNPLTRNTLLSEDCLRQVFLYLPSQDRIKFGLLTSKQLHINLRCWNFPLEPELRWTDLRCSAEFDRDGEERGYAYYYYYASLQGSFLCLRDLESHALSLRVCACPPPKDSNTATVPTTAAVTSLLCLEVPLTSACTPDHCGWLEDYLTRYASADPRYDVVEFSTTAAFENEIAAFANCNVEITIEYVGSFDMERKLVSEPRRVLVAQGYTDSHDCYCHHGDNLVSMWNGEAKKAKLLQVGDVVKSFDGTSFEAAVIEGVAINRIQSQRMALVQLDAVTLVTMGHPILDSAIGWIRPEQKYPLASVSVGAVYNFVVSNRCSIIINGHISSTLGQFCKYIDDENTFFGSERVVNRLKLSSKWPVVKFVS